MRDLQTGDHRNRAMSTGPGKYGDLVTRVRTETRAIGVVMIIFGGNKGSGFSVEGPPGFAEGLPELLEDVARALRAEQVQNN